MLIGYVFLSCNTRRKNQKWRGICPSRFVVFPPLPADILLDFPVETGKELLNLRTFPTLMGYSSRMLAESWESNLLYYGALADETYIPPAQLNVMVPAWTQQTVEKIFATHLEDWPALLRSLRLVGDDVRKSRRQAMTLTAGS